MKKIILTIILITTNIYSENWRDELTKAVAQSWKLQRYEAFQKGIESNSSLSEKLSLKKIIKAALQDVELYKEVVHSTLNEHVKRRFSLNERKRKDLDAQLKEIIKNRSSNELEQMLESTRLIAQGGSLVRLYHFGPLQYVNPEYIKLQKYLVSLGGNYEGLPEGSTVKESCEWFVDRFEKFHTKSDEAIKYLFKSYSKSYILPYFTNFSGHSIYEIAIGKQNYNCLKLAVECGLSLNIPSNVGLPIHRLARFSSVHWVKYVVDHGALIDVQDSSGCTPLSIAADCGKLAIAKFLIEKGAHLNLSDHSRWTPLHKATNFGRYDMVQLLLKAGACVNQYDKCQYTPLHRAAAWGHDRIYNLLVKYGASETMTDKNGKTPREIFGHFGRPQDSIRSRPENYRANGGNVLVFGGPIILGFI